MKFNRKQTYHRTDGWRGYSEPTYAIFGWNDTGTWSDSPCPTDMGIKEAKLAKTFLRKNKIPYRTVTCLTSNVFAVHHYLIVPPELYERAKQLARDFYAKIVNDTNLLYLC